MTLVNLFAALDLFFAISEQGRAVSEKIKMARAENRDLTKVELDELRVGTETALADAKAAGAAAKARELASDGGG